MKPRFELSKSKVLEQYHKAKQWADLVSYSSKTNQQITPVLEQHTDAMFSVHMQEELQHIKDFSRTIFLAQAWSQEHIHDLIQKGIRWFVVDNEPDLNTLCDYLNNHEVTIILLLRMKLKELTIRTERYYVFGMDSATINTKILQLKEQFPQKISSLGIHFHRKTQNMSEWNLTAQFSQLISEETLRHLSYVNIGGGLPSEYANTNTKVLPSITKKIQEFRTWLNGQNIQMILEPGRFIAAPAGKLITHIVNIHGNTLVINASVYNANMDAILVPVKLKVQGELIEGTPYIIKGITPCSMDLFRYRVYLHNPKIGDEIIFQNACAYNFTTDFCDLQKIETIIVD